jgi:hypothetical protein
MGLGGVTNSLASDGPASASMPRAGTLDRFYVRAGTFNSANGTVVYTVVRNGTATSLTCTVTISAGSCSDLSDAVVFAAGDTVSVRIDNNSAGAVRDSRWSGEFS